MHTKSSAFAIKRHPEQTGALWLAQLTAITLLFGVGCGTANIATTSASTCTAATDCELPFCIDGVCSATCIDSADCPDTMECEELSGACVPQTPDLCGSDVDCDAGTTCRGYRGDLEFFASCDPTDHLAAPLGTHCNLDSDCVANLCVNNTCTAPCVANSDCGADFECQAQSIDVMNGTVSADICIAVEEEPPCTDPSCGAIVACTTTSDCATTETCALTSIEPAAPILCVPRDGAKRGTGIPCTDDDQCQSNICLDADDGGTCTELCLDSGNCWLNGHVCEQRLAGALTIAVNVCVPPPPAQECTTSIDCAASGQVCGDIRFDWSVANPVQSYCTSPVAGAGGLGDACSGEFSPNVGCYDRICLSGLSNQCSATCITDADCSQNTSGFICSDVAYGAPLRLCVNACTRDADCEGNPTDPNDNLACALGRNETDDRYDFTCRLPGGTMPTGSDCAAVKDCDHGICLVRNEVTAGTTTEIESVCSQPCETDTDCPSDDLYWDWYCTQVSFARPVSGSAQPARICSREAKI